MTGAQSADESSLVNSGSSAAANRIWQESQPVQGWLLFRDAHRGRNDGGQASNYNRRWSR